MFRRSRPVCTVEDKIFGQLRYARAAIPLWHTRISFQRTINCGDRAQRTANTSMLFLSRRALPRMTFSPVGLLSYDASGCFDLPETRFWPSLNSQLTENLHGSVRQLLNQARHSWTLISDLASPEAVRNPSLPSSSGCDPVALRWVEPRCWLSRLLRFSVGALSLFPLRHYSSSANGTSVT